MKCSRSTACALISALIVANAVPAQFPTTPTTTPKNYADYYQQHVTNFRQPPTNIRNYTINKYYLQNPNISPYLNLTRRGGGAYVNNYYHYVLPEVERRSSMPVAAGGPVSPLATPMPSNLPAVGPTRSAVSAPLVPTGPMSPTSSYSNYSQQYSKWYGGR